MFARHQATGAETSQLTLCAPALENGTWPRGIVVSSDSAAKAGAAYRRGQYCERRGNDAVFSEQQIVQASRMKLAGGNKLTMLRFLLPANPHFALSVIVEAFRPGWRWRRI
jgi:hypothetical protein